ISSSRRLVMTTPNERSRAVIHTEGFLKQLARDTSLPEKVRRDAHFLLRHYPERSDVLLAGRLEEEATMLTSFPFLYPIFGSTIDE
ncbi:BPSL0761 family protein, partial [Pseudomonas viridiflava]